MGQRGRWWIAVVALIMAWQVAAGAWAVSDPDGAWTQQDVPAAIEDEWQARTGASGPVFYRHPSGLVAFAARWPVGARLRWYLLVGAPGRRLTRAEVIDAARDILPGVAMVAVLGGDDPNTIRLVETQDAHLAPRRGVPGLAAARRWLARHNGRMAEGKKKRRPRGAPF